MASAQPSAANRSFGHQLSPAKWLSAYDGFIAKNLGQVSQIESTLRSLTYIIPGRFRDAEIASEAIHSGVQLLSLYHDLLLLRTPAKSPSSESSSTEPMPTPKLLPPQGTGQAPSLHTRYTRYWLQKSQIYRRVAVVLQVVRCTELLCEMTAKRRGERLRWRVVILIEAIKAICNLLLLRVTRGRTLVSPILPVRQPLLDADGEEGDEDLETERDKEDYELGRSQANVELTAPTMCVSDKGGFLNGAAVSPNASFGPVSKEFESVGARPTFSIPPSPPPSESHFVTLSHTKGWAMPRTKMSMPPLPQPDDISSYLLSRVLTADDIKPASKLMNQLRGSAQFSEILHILAPLVFAIALARSRRNNEKRSSWTPWLAGLAMEYAARQLRDHSLRTTSLEREEWNRRGWAMGWWPMRGASYEHVMKGVIGGVRSRMPSFLGGIIEDYEYLWENYYFSTSP